MAEKGVPHFHNELGVSSIKVGSKEFMCIGAKPPFDHPHVFLDMGSDSEIICPYCSTLFVFDAALGRDIASLRRVNGPQMPRRLPDGTALTRR